MNQHHECECNCPNEDWHFELMYQQKNPEPYILSEYDLNLEMGLSGLN